MDKVKILGLARSPVFCQASSYKATKQNGKVDPMNADLARERL
jgi:hypothetical protein